MADKMTLKEAIDIIENNAVPMFPSSVSYEKWIEAKELVLKTLKSIDN